MDVVDVDEAESFDGESFEKVNLFETDRMFSDVYCLEPGQAQTVHSHGDADKVYLVLEGRGTVRVGGDEATLDEGDAVVAEAGADHGIRNEGETRLRALVFMARDATPALDADREEHDHHGEHAHVHGHHSDGEPRSVAVLTVSSTRTEADDEGGRIAREAVEDGGHEAVEHDVVPDDADAIADRVAAFVEADVDAVVTTGGTGLTPDDVTVEALRPLFDREIPGFGEFFRRRSEREVGTAAMLSRATAGVVDGTAVFALPGSPNAVSLGVEELVLPELDHVVSLARR